MDGKKKNSFIVGIVALVTIVVILLVALIFLIIDAGKSAILEILVAPESAEIMIGDKNYKNGTYKIEPGTFTYKIEKSGFKTQTGEMELKEGETYKLYTYLIPNDGSLDWYLMHEDDQMILNTIGDTEANRESAIYLLKNPIVQVLPIIFAEYDANWNYTEYRIDGGEFEDCNADFCLQITDTTGGNYENALERIRVAGFDPADYEIVYKYKPIVELKN